MKKLSLTILAALSFSASANAQTVIDFEELAFDGDTGANLKIETSFTSQGFTFSAPEDLFGLHEFAIPARNSTNNADFGGASVVPTRPANLTTFALTDGGTFDFTSIDLTFAFDDQNFVEGGSSSGGDVTFFFNGSPTGQTVTFDALAGFETFTFNAMDVTSVSFSATSSTTNFAFDNIVIGGPMTAVPEPASWAMMIAGFGLVGGTLRRSRRTQAVALA